MSILKVFVRAGVCFVAALLFSACADLPSGPREAPVRQGGALYSGECQPRGDGTYVCPVIPIWGDECDPYHFDCGEDDCITSASSGDGTTQGCNGGGGDAGGGGEGDDSGGGGGGGGGGESGAPACPDYGCEEPPPPPDDDYIDADTIPDCSKPLLLDWEHAYCTSESASGERLTRTLNALDRITARGGECAVIATVGQQLLATGQFRYFPHVESIHGDKVGWGDGDIGVLLAEQWADNFGGTPTGFPNFDLKVAHEIEHAMGRQHVPGTTETPNSLACAGFSGG